MSLSSLSRPVSTLMRPTFLVPKETTLGGVASKLRENSSGLVPIVDEGNLIGVVDEKSLAAAVALGASHTDGVEIAFHPDPPVIRLYESGAEALRVFERLGLGSLIVVDDNNRVVGVLRASDLVDAPDVTLRPQLIGGMATPFGVYLTSGATSGGAKGWALVATGALLFSILSTVSILCSYLYLWLVQIGWPIVTADAFTNFLVIALFAASFRLLPISGTHAAEHMVVHTIERGEPLIPSVVKRMPRVHPRCGTNLAVGASLYLSVATTKAIPDDNLRLLFALVVTLVLWRRIGSWVQYWITTRPPTDKQIESAIRAAKELLERQSKLKTVGVSIPTRLWSSGMFHVMAGAALVVGLLTSISALFPKWNLPF
ncbi:MAG: DUF1385 domain-containing protein [Chlorobia bacterium]|nr:DUF1385 domain-containing protein [Fimbriimonadaceae bacterium]